MQKIDYLEAQSKLAKTMRQVCEQDTAVTINGAGKDQVVMMPLETFKRLNNSRTPLPSSKNTQPKVKALIQDRTKAPN